MSNHAEAEEIELEWEEWDGKSPFLHHCIAGSIAGVAEHVLLYPVDTVKTHMQAYCSTCPNNPANKGISSMKSVCTGPPSKAPVAVAPNGMWSTVTNLIQHGHGHSQVNIPRRTGTLTTASSPPAISASAASTLKPQLQTGYIRLWRGVQTMATGCIPAHALYFSSYEYMKSILSTKTISPTTGVEQEHLGTFGASMAGAVSTLAHDMVMTPLDTIKQRMQLGYYDSMGHAVRQIVHLEGCVGLYRSFGITVLTNIPYGMVMMSTNEFLRDALTELKQPRSNVLDLETTMLAGCGAGAVAAFVTSPMDRVKTRLQTQTLAHAFPATTAGNLKSCPKASAALAQASLEMSKQAKYKNLSEAFSSIAKEEGFVGLFRGVVPRMMTHTPAVAISWTAYESGKRWLSSYN